jgi:phage N-6-adenine-methyltransferase
VSEVVVITLSREEARSLTDEVKHDAARLWGKLVELRDGRADLALGYSSWGAYYEAEFGGSQWQGYKLLGAGRVVGQLSKGPIPPPKNEAQARELAPLLDQPDQLQEAWSEASANGKPTAEKVREAVQNRMGVHYSSESPDWSTPQDLFDELNREFAFDVDVCATPETAKCAKFFTEQADGLAQDWLGTCFMNPPYGDGIGRWVRKAHESGANGTTVVCLVPGRIDTAWWWDYCRFGEVRILRGRLRFGGGDTGAPFPSVVVIFGPKAKPNALDVHWERAA